MSQYSLGDLPNPKDYIQEENYFVANSDEDDALKSFFDSDTDSSDSNDFVQRCEENSTARDEELKKRMDVLRTQMSILKDELETEKHMCKKVVDDITECQGMCLSSLCIHSSQCLIHSTDILTSASFGNFITPSDYSLQIDSYHVALAHRQQYDKINLQRQLAMKHYRRRLQEVEEMCNMELLKVKESVINLQPLRLIVLEWEKEMNGGRGDAVCDTGPKIIQTCDEIVNRPTENSGTSFSVATNEQGDVVKHDTSKKEGA